MNNVLRFGIYSEGRKEPVDVYLEQPSEDRVSVWNKLALVAPCPLVSQGRDNQTQSAERPGGRIKVGARGRIMTVRCLHTAWSKHNSLRLHFKRFSWQQEDLMMQGSSMCVCVLSAVKLELVGILVQHFGLLILLERDAAKQPHNHYTHNIYTYSTVWGYSFYWSETFDSTSLGQMFISLLTHLLMLLPSFSLSPAAPVFAARSLPARSTKLSLLTFSPFVWSGHTGGCFTSATHETELYTLGCVKNKEKLKHTIHCFYPLKTFL